MSYATDLPSAPVLETIYRHCSIRKYSDEPVADATLTAILEAGRAASSSSFMQCVHVLHITDEAIRQGLYTVAAEQKYVRDAPVFLVFCVDYAKHKQVVPQAQVDWTEAMIRNL